MQTVQVTENFGLGGISFDGNRVLEADEVFSVVTEVPAAVSGVLTTRTDNDTGTLTMDDAGHGITTGARLDLYWTGGARRRMTVGTVAGLSVPIDLGAGDNLPAATTPIIACVPVERSFPLVNADLIKIAVKGDVECQFTFMEADGTTEDLTYHLEPAVAGASVIGTWDAAYGASPLTGTDIAEVWMSHNDVNAAHILSAAYLSD